jgi:heparan-alpha-glucosaminide N-acetyltransferase
MDTGTVLKPDMNIPNQAVQRIKTGRIKSIDIIRGFTILVMIFVNDLAGVANVPAWMMHESTMHDGMTFVDWVFPGFLFIVGMSIPFSIGRRIEKGEPLSSIWKHIFIRVAGLLILGLFMVNGDNISNEGIINPDVWALLMYIFVIILWNKNGNSQYFLSKKWIKYFAAAGLIALFFLFRGGEQTGVVQMRPEWWGILGLIGWAYLVACLFYIPFKNNPFALLGAAVFLFCFYLGANAGMLKDYFFIQILWPKMYVSYTLSSHPAIVILGVILGMKLREDNDNPNHANILKWAFSFSIFLLITGLVLHQLNKINPMFIISKNLATVPWCLLSSTFTIWIWIVVYWLVDIKGHNSWFKVIEPAGTNPLFAYVLAPLVVEIFAIIALVFNGFDIYSWFGESFITGFLRAVFIAFSMTWLAGYLSKRGLRLRL